MNIVALYICNKQFVGTYGYTNLNNIILLKSTAVRSINLYVEQHLICIAHTYRQFYRLLSILVGHQVAYDYLLAGNFRSCGYQSSWS